MVESKAFACQNPSCKKTFTSPLKTLNLQQSPTEPYYACPYCLTKIKEIESPRTEHETEGLNVKPKEKASVINSPKSDKETGCQHHLGYLSERTSKSQIPDDCLVCKSIVECMLKKMSDQ